VSYRFIAAAMAASLAASPAAAAGPSAQSAPARVLLLLPLTLTKVDDLHFGTIVSLSVAGTVTINASSGARTHAGGVTEIASDAGQRALFAWAGTPNQQVNFDIVYPATLDDGAGNSVQVALLYLQSDSVIANSAGVVQVGVGGSILISANQAEGTYSNTFDVTANYP
jgi:Domain of unknown function (DUF4402)